MPKRAHLDDTPQDRKTIAFKVPSRLLERFDYVAKHNDFSRGEALKQAMRDFIDNYSETKRTPKEEIEESTNALVHMFTTMAKLSEHPEIKKLQQQPQQQQLPQKEQKG